MSPAIIEPQAAAARGSCSSLSANIEAVSSQPRYSRPSREAEFSTALWKLDKDWEEQADVQANPRPRRFVFFGLLGVLVYVLSTGPIVLILRTAGSPYRVTVACKYFYCPLIWLHAHTPLHKPIQLYLDLWGGG